MKRFGRKSMFGAIGTLVAIGIGAALLGAVGIVGWEYTNSDEFCAVMQRAGRRWRKASAIWRSRGARART